MSFALLGTGQLFSRDSRCSPCEEQSEMFPASSAGGWREGNRDAGGMYSSSLAESEASSPESEETS